MGGLEIMLKSMGLDPVEIKKNVAGFGQIIVSIDARLQRIEAQQNEIVELAKGLYAADRTPTAAIATIAAQPGASEHEQKD